MTDAGCWLWIARIGRIDGASPGSELPVSVVPCAIGERPLGIQAAQLSAVARFAHDEHPGEGIKIIAVGPRAGMAALVAAAIATDAIQAVELAQGWRVWRS